VADANPWESAAIHWRDLAAERDTEICRLRKKVAELEDYLPRAVETASIEAGLRSRSAFAILLGAGDLEAPEDAATRLRARVEDLETRLTCNRAILKARTEELNEVLARLEALAVPPVLPEGWKLEKSNSSPDWILRDPYGWIILRGGRGATGKEWSGAGARAFVWAVEKGEPPPKDDLENKNG
jgi:hypothetical protein